MGVLVRPVRLHVALVLRLLVLQVPQAPLVLRVVVGVLSVGVEYQLPYLHARLLGAEFEECLRDGLGGVGLAGSGHAEQCGALRDEVACLDRHRHGLRGIGLDDGG